MILPVSRSAAQAVPDAVWPRSVARLTAPGAQTASFQEGKMKTIAAVVLFAIGIAPAHAGALKLATSVPTLDEGGLIALIAVIGVVAGLVARRRKK